MNAGFKFFLKVGFVGRVLHVETQPFRDARLVDLLKLRLY